MFADAHNYAFRHVSLVVTVSLMLIRLTTCALHVFILLHVTFKHLMLHKIFWFCSSKKVSVLVSKNFVYIIVHMSFPFNLLLFSMCNVRCSIIFARLLAFAHQTSSTFFLPMTARSAKRILLILILSFCLSVCLSITTRY